LKFAIDQMADRMRDCKRNPKSQLMFSLISDAIYWTDELPECLKKHEEDALRFILNYRTKIICGIEDDTIKPLWTRATQAFPEWIGFLEERTTRSATLCNAYKKMSSEAEVELPDTLN